MSEDEYVKKCLSDLKTSCCNLSYYTKGRADLRCSGCDKDVTMELVLLTYFLIEDFKNKK